MKNPQSTVLVPLLAFFIIFMAFMALGILKIERIKEPAKPLISQADQRINNTPRDWQHTDHRIANRVQHLKISP